MRLFNDFTVTEEGETTYLGDFQQVGAGGSHTFTFREPDARKMGIRRVLFQPLSPAADVRSTLSVGRDTLWSGVLTETTNDLFRETEYNPPLPIQVAAGEPVSVQVDNNQVSSQYVRCILEVYAGRRLDERLSAIENYVGTVPDTGFAYVTDTVPAGRSNFRVDVSYPPGEWRYDKFGLTVIGNVNPEDVYLELAQKNKIVIEKTRGQAYSAFASNRTSPGPITVGPTGPLQLRISNRNQNNAAIASGIIPLYSESAFTD